MKVTEKNLPDGRVRLDAIASTAEVSNAFETAQRVFAQSMNVFLMPGKTVAQAVEEQLGVKDLDAIVRPQAIEYLIPFALDKHNLVPAFPPQAQSEEPLRRGKTFSFTLEVTPKPKYELSSYDPVSITVPPMQVSPAEIDAKIEQIKDSFARFVADEPHAVGPTDAFKISMEATSAGEPLKALCTDERMYMMGQGFLSDEFDGNVLGMNVGETKSFSFSLPGAQPGNDDPIECTVTVKEMLKKEEPELTDEWVASTMPMYPSVDALRQSIEAEIVRERSAQHESMKMQIAAGELAKRFQGRIADEVYEAVRGQLISEMRANLQQQGVPFDQFIQSQGGEQQFGMMLMLQTRQMVVQGYSLDALFRHEKMELTDEDIMNACRTINAQNPVAVKQMAEQSGSTFALREIAERMKANRWLLDHAQVTVFDPSAQGQAGESEQDEKTGASAAE